MILDLMTVVTVRTPRHREGRQTKFPSHHIPATANCGQVGFAVNNVEPCALIGDEVAIVGVPLTTPLPWVTVTASPSRMRYEWRMASLFPAFVSR